MGQVDFDASDASEALRKGPYEVDLSQHAGGERSNWTDPKLQKQGTHPVIYDATGSHANYFGSALYLGRGAREGFGCDDTRTATTRLQLQTVLLPEVPSSASRTVRVACVPGRWGQKEKGINNGPTGPATKPQWRDPIAWSEGLRNTSVELPSGRTFGVSVGNFFCGAVTVGATVFDWSLIHPVPFVERPPSRRWRAVRSGAGDDLAATGSTSPPAAAARRSDLQSDATGLRSQPADVRRGRSKLRSGRTSPPPQSSGWSSISRAPLLWWRSTAGTAQSRRFSPC